ncbi:hypothetical protein ROHU_001117 [Labeo rohita]|uniref:Integrase catalytic domain-containing protein n=2 Tax=Labeonini TaxID=2743697 RepID=A0A498P4S0_LABRO|nr:hypothetical protein ROHU_001117 [Labeo rohita]
MARSVAWSRVRLLDPETANSILNSLSEFMDILETLPQPQVHQAYSAPLERGFSGRPQYSITQEQLRFLLEYNFSTKQMAEILGVSKRTVKRRLRKYNISLRDRYSNLSDSDLDNLVREVVQGNDELGAEAVRARLAGQGIVVQRCRVRQSLIRTNPIGAAQRVTTRRLHRRIYEVAGPNSLWHLDGNHKLIRWRIVIHGGIDGYSRLVVFLKASDNNRSNTVFDSFVDAIGKHGLPSRVRCDNGEVVLLFVAVTSLAPITLLLPVENVSEKGPFRPDLFGTTGEKRNESRCTTELELDTDLTLVPSFPLTMFKKTTVTSFQLEQQTMTMQSLLIQDSEVVRSARHLLSLLTSGSAAGPSHDNARSIPEFFSKGRGKRRMLSMPPSKPAKTLPVNFYLLPHQYERTPKESCLSIHNLYMLSFSDCMNIRTFHLSKSETGICIRVINFGIRTGTKMQHQILIYLLAMLMQRVRRLPTPRPLLTLNNRRLALWLITVNREIQTLQKQDP